MIGFDGLHMIVSENVPKNIFNIFMIINKHIMFRPGRRGGSGGSNEPPRSSRSSAKLCPKSRNTQARAACAYARLGCFISTDPYT